MSKSNFTDKTAENKKEVAKAAGALAGVKVLDLSRLLPGPYCSMMLADLGADVIKIEEPGKGDYLREFPPKVNREGAMYLAVNRNKRSMTLNLKSKIGREILMELAKSADVLLEGFRPGVMDKLGLGYSDLEKVNPGLVYCSISGYGQEGPARQKAGHDINYLALAGVLGFTGTRDGVLAVPGVQIADIGGGAMLAAFSILAALLAREKTGVGQYIDVAMMDGVISWLSMFAGKYFADGVNPGPGETMLNGGIPCYNLYGTKDGRYMALGALESRFWTAFCNALGREDLIPKQFATGNVGREVIQELETIFVSKTKDEWVKFLEGVDCCCEPVNNFKEVFEHPQVKQRNLVREVEHPTEGKIRQISFPAKFSKTPADIRLAPPSPGQHTGEILSELGYSEQEIKKLAEEKVI